MSNTQKLIAVIGASGRQVPQELFAGGFPGAKEIAEMLAYLEAHTYLESDSRDAIARANKIADRQPTKFAAWVRANFAIRTGSLKTRSVHRL